MYELPIQIEIDGVKYNIRNNGDYRMVLDAFSVLNDEELNQQERVLASLLIFYEDMTCLEDVLAISDLEKATEKMFEFFNAGRPETSGPSRKLIDWDEDSAMISSAINKVAGQEIRSVEYMHWWTFMGYFNAIGESTLSTVVSIRDKILKDKKLEKWERDFRNENTQYFIWNHKTVEDKEAESWLKDVWNKE